MSRLLSPSSSSPAHNVHSALSPLHVISPGDDGGEDQCSEDDSREHEAAAKDRQRLVFGHPHAEGTHWSDLTGATRV